MSWEIYVNRIRCLKCNDIIESKHRHDYVSCKCGACSVDGGHDYLKRTGDFLYIQDLSISKWVSTTDFEDSLESKNPYHIPEYLFSTDEPETTNVYLVFVQDDNHKDGEFQLVNYYKKDEVKLNSLYGWMSDGKVKRWVNASITDLNFDNLDTDGVDIGDEDNDDETDDVNKDWTPLIGIIDYNNYLKDNKDVLLSVNGTRCDYVVIGHRTTVGFDAPLYHKDDKIVAWMELPKPYQCGD